MRVVALLGLPGVLAGLARVFAQGIAQQVQALVGAGGQIGQRAREGFQPCVLLPAQPFELLAQFTAAGPRLFTQALLKVAMAGTPQQGYQLQDEDGTQQAAKDEEFRLHGRSVG